MRNHKVALTREQGISGRVLGTELVALSLDLVNRLELQLLFKRHEHSFAICQNIYST